MATGATRASIEYANNCYPDSSYADYDCDKFSVRRINATVNQYLPCFFTDPSTCISDLYNIQINTGYIDSNRDLGINAPSQNSVAYRRVSECAPMNFTKWVSSYNLTGSPGSLPDDRYEYFYLGPYIYSGKVYTDYTYAVDSYSVTLQNDAYVLGYALNMILLLAGELIILHPGGKCTS